MRQLEKRKQFFIAGIILLAVGLIFFYKSLSERQSYNLNRDVDMFFLFSKKETTPELIFNFLFNNSLNIDQQNKLNLSFDSVNNAIKIQILKIETEEILSYNKIFSELDIAESEKKRIDSILNNLAKDFRRQFYSNKNAVLINLKYVFASKELAAQITTDLIEKNYFNLSPERKKEVVKNLLDRANSLQTFSSNLNDNYFISINRNECNLVKRNDGGILKKIRFEIMIDYNETDTIGEKKGRHKNFDFSKSEYVLPIDIEIADIKSVSAADFYIKQIFRSLIDNQKKEK